MWKVYLKKKNLPIMLKLFCRLLISVLKMDRQNEYVVLLPIGDSDGQVVILQLKEIDDETEEYVGVENEFVLETVFALFKERNKDFFTFE